MCEWFMLAGILISVLCSLLQRKGIFEHIVPPSLLTEMRGAAMSLTAAASGLVVFLLSVSAVQGQDGWGVTYSSTEICAVKGSTAEINCTYTYPSPWKGSKITVNKTFWFTEWKGGKPVDLKTVSEYAGRVEDRCESNTCTLRIRNLTESDSAEYKFRFKTNHPDGKYSGSPGVTLSVTDAPKLPSVSVSPSAEIEEGSSVTLTCSSEANPAANYTWYKKDGKQKRRPLTNKTQLVLSSIQVSDSGEYFCTAENKLGAKTSNISIDVKYAPKPPSVSVFPSAEIEEGSSVTLTCSSEANPAANYIWYKEDEDSPKASGQIFTITDFRAEHSGSYSCGAQNKLGRSNSTLHLSVGTGSWILEDIIRMTLGVLMLIPVFLLSLWMRKKKALRSTTEAHEPEEIELDSIPEYENDPHTAAQTEDREEQGDMV
ncbi:hypothetical protein NQZ68_030575 [Dissostichus eleginoides]|nr:hypothetical protein NQZ68_030575 [Dissostichus eleginoides]